MGVALVGLFGGKIICFVKCKEDLFDKKIVKYQLPNQTQIK